MFLGSTGSVVANDKGHGDSFVEMELVEGLPWEAWKKKNMPEDDVEALAIENQVGEIVRDLVRDIRQKTGINHGDWGGSIPWGGYKLHHGNVMIVGNPSADEISRDNIRLIDWSRSKRYPWVPEAEASGLA